MYTAHTAGDKHIRKHVKTLDQSKMSALTTCPYHTHPTHCHTQEDVTLSKSCKRNSGPSPGKGGSDAGASLGKCAVVTVSTSVVDVSCSFACILTQRTGTDSPTVWVWPRNHLGDVGHHNATADEVGVEGRPGPLRHIPVLRRTQGQAPGTR